MEDKTESEYPSVRKALLGNGTVANIRCAIKYVLWQLSYVLTAVVGTIFIVFAVLFELIGSSRAAEYVVSGKNRFVNNDIVKRAGRIAVYGLAALVVLGVVGIVIFNLIFYTFDTLLVLGAIVGSVVVAAGLVFVLDLIEGSGPAKKTVRVTESVTSKAKETPGIRRVYGKCPVHWEIEPKWYKKIQEY